MKRLIVPALLIALLVIAWPATSQDAKKTLPQQVEELKKQVSNLELQIQELRRYGRMQKAEAQLLSKALEKAEEGGFTYPAPHAGAKKALLEGLQRYAKKTAADAK